MNRDKLIEQSVSDAVTAKPIRFSITYGEKFLYKYLPFLYKRNKKIENFEIHPPTLGKMQILSKLYLQLEFDEDALEKEPHIEAMRVCETHTDIVCQLMAVSVCKTDKELLSDKCISKKAEFFKWYCSPDDFSSCLLALLSQVDYSAFITSIRLTKMLRLNKPTEKRASRIEQ